MFQCFETTFCFFPSVGFFGFSLLPIGFELATENTFPIDSTTGISFVYFAAQIQAVILIALSGVMETELSAEELEIEVSITKPFFAVT